MVEQLARQHSHLEQAAQKQANAPPGSLVLAHSIHSEEDEDNEFFDAEEDEMKADYIVQVPIGHRRTPSGVSTNSQVMYVLKDPLVLYIRNVFCRPFKFQNL